MTTQTPYQDQDVHHPSVRLRAVLALLRVVAGRRGWAHVRWSGAGFTYRISVVRQPPRDYALDADPDALNGDRAADELRGHLAP